MVKIMTKSNKTFLKSILATASTLAIAVGGASEAGAAALRTTTGNATLSTQGGIAAWATGDAIKLANSGHTLALDAVNATTAIGVAAGINANTATVTANVTLHAVGNDNTGAAATGPMKLTFGGVATVILDGAGTNLTTTPIAANDATTYNQLGTVDFANHASTVSITGHGLTFANAFDSTAGAAGTLTTSGLENLFTGKIGNSNALTAINVNNDATFKGSVIQAGAIKIADAKTMTIDSSTADINVTGTIDGAGANQGILSIEGNNNTTIHSAVGTTHNPLASITITSSANATTFNAAVMANAIDASGAGAAVIFDDVVNTGSLLTGTGNTTVTGIATIATDITLGGDATFTANVNATNIHINGNTATVNGAATITGNLVTMGNAVTGGTFAISNADVTLAGDVGADGNSLTAINFVTDNTLTINGAHTIFATNISTGIDTKGTLKIQGGAVGITGDIGKSGGNKLAVVNISDGNTLTVTGNIYTVATTLSNAAANLTIIGGTTLAPNKIYGTIKGTDAVNGQGKITVGTGTVGNVEFRGELGNTNNLQLLTVGDGSSASFFENATFKPLANGAAGSAGILIGNGSTVTVTNGKVLTLTGNASINGIADDQGTIVFVNQDSPEAIGVTHPLKSIRFDQWAAGPHLPAHALHATTLDLTGGSIVTLDANTAVANITGGITSSDSTSVDFTSSYATFATNGGPALNIANLGVSAKITGTGTLSAASATPDQPLVNQNKALVDFLADGTFEVNGDGLISDITNNSGAAAGTFKGTFAGGAANLSLLGTVGGAGVASLKELNFTGRAGGAADTVISITTATNIYATTITQNATKLQSTANDLTINSTNYNITDAAFNVGDKTITATGTVTLSGTITINATFVNANHPVLDLSGAQFNGNTVANLALNIAGMPPAPNTSMIIFKTTAGNIVQPLKNTVGYAFNSADWTYQGTPGVIVYKYIAPAGGGVVAPVNPAINLPNGITFTPPTTGSFGVAGNGPSSEALTAAATALVTLGNGGSAFATTGPLAFSKDPTQTAAGAIPNFDPLAATSVFTPIAGNLPTNNSLAGLQVNPVISQFASQQLVTFNTPDKRTAVQQIIGQAVSHDPTAPVPQNFGITLATTMAADNRMPQALAAAVLNQGTAGGASNDTVQQIVKVAALGGEGAATQMLASINDSAKNAAAGALADVGTRLAFVNIVPATSVIPSINPSSAGNGGFGAPVSGNGGFAVPVGGTSTSSSGSGRFSSPSAGGSTTSSGSGGLSPSSTNEQSGIAGPAGIPGKSGPANASDSKTNQPNPRATDQNADSDLETPGDDLQAVALGTAAGSNPYDRFGVWGSINGGFARQKLHKGNPGFKSFSKGAAIGVDTMINDLTTIGFTVSNSINHIKHKDASAGNKTDSSSWVGAIYGNHQLRNNWFIRGTALFNRTHMNSKELRPIVGGFGIAQAKYNLISYGGEANVGYSHRFRNDIVLTPTVGLRVIHNNKSNYGQQGSTAQNNKVSTNAINNYSALAGISVAKTVFKYGISFTPEAHANIQYGINQKSPTGSFVSPLTPTQSTSFVGTKSSKITSSCGLGLTGSSDRIEVGITGDVSFASKYVGYQGSLKVKVKF